MEYQPSTLVFLLFTKNFAVTTLDSNKAKLGTGPNEIFSDKFFPSAVVACQNYRSAKAFPGL